MSSELFNMGVVGLFPVCASLLELFETLYSPSLSLMTPAQSKVLLLINQVSRSGAHWTLQRCNTNTYPAPSPLAESDKFIPRCCRSSRIKLVGGRGLILVILLFPSSAPRRSFPLQTLVLSRIQEPWQMSTMGTIEGGDHTGEAATPY